MNTCRFAEVRDLDSEEEAHQAKNRMQKELNVLRIRSEAVRMLGIMLDNAEKDDILEFSYSYDFIRDDDDPLPTDQKLTAVNVRLVTEPIRGERTKVEFGR